MVKHYHILIPPESNPEKKLNIDGLLNYLDDHIVGIESVKVGANFMPEINIDISSQVVEALRSSLGLEKKINSYAETGDKYLYTDISHQIVNTQNINQLIEIIEYLLGAFILPRTINNEYFKRKTSYYRLYGNKKTMKSRGKNNLPIITISGEKYYLDMKADIEQMRKLVEGLWNYLHQDEDIKRAA